MEGSSSGRRQPQGGGVLRQGAVAREAAGGTSEWKRHGGAGTKKIRWRCPFKGRDGEAAKGGSSGEDATRRGAGLGPGPDRIPTGRGALGQRGSVSGRGTPGKADAWAPAGSGRGRKERGMGRAWAGLEEKGLGRARRNCDVWDLFKSISN
jgi:hypothetical protein